MWLLTVVLPAATAVLTVAALVDTRHLPNELATHWKPNGTADGSMSRAALRISTVVIAAFAIAVMLIASQRRLVRNGAYRVLAAVAAMFGVIFPLLTLQTASTNSGSADWHLVPGPAVWKVFAAVVLGLLAGALALAATTHAAPKPIEVSQRPPLDLAADERAVWLSSAHNRFLVGSGAAAIGLAAVLEATTERWVVALPLLIVGVSLAALSSVNVRVDEGGLTIHYSVLPFVHTHLGYDEIDGAESIVVKPMSWGGWGYRGSLKALGRAAVVIRAGDGIRVTLAGGKEFAVTVDDSANGAALLNSLSRRHSNA